MSKKWFTLIAILSILAMLLTACGSTNTTEVPSNEAPDSGEAASSSADDADSAASDEPVEVIWWQLTQNDLQLAALNEIIADFEAANPGIIVTMETRAIDAQKEALRVAAGTEAFPDIYFMWSGLGLGGEFVGAGSSAALDEYYEQYGWLETLSPPAIAAATQYGDGHYHGVMSEIHGQVLYYKKDLFEAAGITEEPQTYEELLAVNDKLVASGVKPIQFGGTVNWHLMRLLDNLLETECGPETHDALKAMSVSWADTACVTDAFTELKKWSDDYIVEDFIGIDSTESTQLLYADMAAMALEGDWMNGSLLADGEVLSDYGIFIFPTGTGRLYSFAQGNYVGNNSKHIEEAVKFLDYFVSEEVQSKYLGTFGSISVNQNATPPADQDPLDVEWIGIFGAATGSFQNSDQAFPLDVTTEYWRIMNLVAIGDLDPAQAGAEFQTFIDNQ